MKKIIAVIIFGILIGCNDSPPTKTSTETQVIKKNWSNSKKAIGRVKWFDEKKGFGFKKKVAMMYLFTIQML